MTLFGYTTSGALCDIQGVAGGLLGFGCCQDEKLFVTAQFHEPALNVGGGILDDLGSDVAKSAHKHGAHFSHQFFLAYRDVIFGTDPIGWLRDSGIG